MALPVVCDCHWDGQGQDRVGGVTWVGSPGRAETSAHHPSCVQCDRTDTSNQLINEFRSGSHICALKKMGGWLPWPWEGPGSQPPLLDSGTGRKDRLRGLQLNGRGLQAALCHCPLLRESPPRSRDSSPEALRQAPGSEGAVPPCREGFQLSASSSLIHSQECPLLEEHSPPAWWLPAPSSLALL